jgi:Flp pilus assembly protein TadB
MRVSDAERAEVADRLSKHYSDGRLDEAEFNERIDQAMRAKTHANLSGLLDDLPASEPSGTPKAGHTSGTAAPVPGPRPARRNHRFLELVLIVVVAVIAWNILVHSFIPWLLIGVIAVLWLLYGPRRHRRP